MTPKKKIPDSLRERVLQEAGYRCAYCGHRDGLSLTAHHIEPESSGGETSFDNLIALCFNCHHRVDETKTIPAKDIRRLKRYLVHERLTQAGVNALKLSYEHSVGVIAAPFAVQHLVERKLLRCVKWQESYSADDTDGETIVQALYRITPEG